MTISSSTIISDSPQKDGRRRIDEHHTDQFGVVHHGSYLCEAGFDASAQLSINAARLSESMKQDEMQGMITGYPWNYEQTESTTNELVAYVRAAYKNGSKETLVPIASRILEWITNGRFTDTQVRNAFGLTAAQWTTLKNKMTALVSANATIQTAVGE